MYEETSTDPIKYVVIGFLVLVILLGLIFIPFGTGKAQTGSYTATKTKTPSFADSISANTLCSAGLGCDETSQQTAPSSPGLLGGLFGGSSAKVDPILTVVNVPGEKTVYRIEHGMKHNLPTSEIVGSYGISLAVIQDITQQELDKYPLARLFIVEGTEEDENPQIYYLTEGGMLRPILNDKVFYSYGDRKEDVISINQKEFNYYPRNQYVYLERPKLNREIYQITGGLKRYVTPVAVKRLNLKENEIAPVNQIEFDEYPEGEPVIF